MEWRDSDGWLTKCQDSLFHINILSLDPIFIFDDGLKIKHAVIEYECEKFIKNNNNFSQVREKI